MGSITHATMASGLSLVTEPSTLARSVGLTMVVPGGVVHDPEGMVGLSAITGELALRGAGDRGSRAFADALDTIGANLDTHVGSRYLNISGTCLGPNLPALLELLGDLVLRPRFDDSQFEPARDLALQALESLKDDPQQRVQHLLRGRHHPPPFDRSTDGSAAGLQAATLEACRAQWRARVVPSGSVLALAGDIDHDAAADAVEACLEGWAGETEAIAYPGDGATRGHLHEPAETDQVHIAAAAEAPAEPDERSAAMQVLVGVLSGGMGARLFTEVREKRGLVYAVNARYAGDRDFGVFGVYAGTTPQRSQETADVIRAELERIGTEAGLPTDDEVERAKVGLKSRLVFSGESTAGRSAALARDIHTRGRPLLLEEKTAAIDAVTPDSLRRFAGDHPIRLVTMASIGSASIESGL